MNQCYGLVTVWLNRDESVVNVEFKGNILYNNEIFMEIKTEGFNDLFVHDSIAHVKRVRNKRLMTSRDLGSNFFPMVNGASLRKND